MKILVVSDIHGSSASAEKCAELLESAKADQLLLLGDYLYHGPRNPLPQEYNPKLVIQELNRIKEMILGVRGNCDSEVDQMVLEFDMMSDYVVISNEGRRIFATHGHLYSPERLPHLNPNEAFLFGHTHLPVAMKKDGIYLMNPGSITLPKEGNPRSYGILDENGFTVYQLDGTILKSIAFDK